MSHTAIRPRRRRPRPSCRWPCSRQPGPPASPASAPRRGRRRRAGRRRCPTAPACPTEAIKAPASVSAPGDARPRRPRQRRRRSSPPPPPAASRRPRWRPTSAPRPSSTPPTRPATCPGSWSRRSAASSPTTAAPTATRSTSNGVARPGIYGIRARRHARHRADPDTDAGQYDDDTALRPRGRPDAVHPLDLVGRRRGRRRRRPAQPAGHRRRGARDRGLPLLRQRRPVDRRRPAGRGLPLQPQRSRYVDLVLAIMRAYAGGDFTSVPNGTTSTGYLSLGTAAAPGRPGTTTAAHGTTGTSGTGDAGGSPTSGPTAGSTDGADRRPVRRRRPAGDRRRPDAPASDAADQPPLPTCRPAPPVDDVLTKAAGDRAVPGRGLVDNPLDPNDAFDQCVARRCTG